MPYLNEDVNTGKQYRQCSYNVTLRRVRATTVVVEKRLVLQILRMCL